MASPFTPISLDQVADQLERLLLCYEELRRTNALLQGQLQDVTQERDSLKSRLSATKERIDSLLARIPKTDTPAASSSVEPCALINNSHDYAGCAIASEQDAP